MLSAVQNCFIYLRDRRLTIQLSRMECGLTSVEIACYGCARVLAGNDCFDMVLQAPVFSRMKVS